VLGGLRITVTPGRCGLELGELPAGVVPLDGDGADEEAGSFDGDGLAEDGGEEAGSEDGDGLAEDGGEEAGSDEGDGLLAGADEAGALDAGA
jgi:streptogrisin D